MLPNFLIVGAEKSGTTWLYSRLRRHFDIYMPGVKELHYFNKNNSNLEQPANNFESQGLEWYASHFQDADTESAVGEATPMYLCDVEAPARIQSTLPNVKLIACLRNPVDRAYSHYWMARGKAHTSRSFEKVVDQKESRFIERGCYGKQLDRYLDYFNREQLLILIHEEVFSSPSDALNQICSFLGVEDTYYQDQSWITEDVHSSSTERSILLHRAIGTIATWMRGQEGLRQFLDLLKKSEIAHWIKQANKKPRDYPEMPANLRDRLVDYYRPTVKHVEQMLGRPISVWTDYFN